MFDLVIAEYARGEVTLGEADARRYGSSSLWVVFAIRFFWRRASRPRRKTGRARRPLDETVRVAISRLRTTYTFGAGSKAQQLTPAQLLERLGFSSAQLSTPAKDLSGGQKRSSNCC